MATTESHADVTLTAAAPRAATGASARSSEWRFVALLMAVALVLTFAPYLFATATAPAGKQFMGLALNVPDHVQYFSWMRDLATANLAADRLTPEPNDPALFNLLWWIAGRAGSLFRLDAAAVHALLRLVSIPLLLGCAYGFFKLAIADPRQRRIAMVLFTFGGGLGIVWIAVKYLARLPEAPFPFDIYTSEPNTFINLLGFPHFSIALALMIATFGLLLVALQRRQLRYAAASGGVALILGLQHAYDLVTIYAVLSLFGLLTWLRDRRFPAFLFVCGLIMVVISVPPAAYAFLLVEKNPLWAEVLAQFDLAGAFTPGPLHLPILLGVPFLLALAAFRPRALQSRSDVEIFAGAWFLAHFPLVYLPLDFQIHLLLGWQAPIAILASAALVRLGLALGQRLRVSANVIAGGLIALSLITNAYVLAWRFIELRRYETPYFMPKADIAALEWLAGRTSRDDVVLAALDAGQWVPAWTDARAYVAHWTGTLDFLNKRDSARAFVDGRLAVEEQRALLRDFNVTYVIHSSLDDPVAQEALAESPYLSAVFSQEGTTVYRVQGVY